MILEVLEFTIEMLLNFYFHPLINPILLALVNYAWEQIKKDLGL